MRRGIGWGAVTLLAAALLGWGPEPRGQEAFRLLEDYGTEITVYGNRLAPAERKLLDTAAGVAVVTREELETAGVRTLQEALALVPGVVLHDAVGNGVETSVDLRGFPQGTSLAVFLDGVRINDLQDNAVRWDTLPVEDIERIEVYRGASGPMYGGGALAGVVNVITRRDPGIPRLDLTAGAGSFGAWKGRLHAAGSRGPLEFYLSGMTRKATGWRENDGYRLDDALFRLNATLPGRQSLALLAKYAGGAESAPGALTAEEMARDREQSPFNRFDGTRGRHRLASLTYGVSWGENWSLSLQGYERRHDRDTLTTGRYGSGFFTTSEERLGGATAEIRGTGTWSRGTWEVSAGAEGSSGRFDGRGFFTDTTGGGKVPASDTGTRERFRGAFAQGDLGWGPLHLLAGFRGDRAEYRYRDRRTPQNDAQRTFRENTRRLGTLLHLGERQSLFLTWSEGFRIPTVVDLFAYPGFYSNPGLVPTRARDWEAGWRYAGDGLRADVTVFRMRLRDEVVFVLTDPQWFIGQNQNVGRSRRDGVEANLRLPVGRGFTLFSGASYLESQVTAGPYAHTRVPQVPRITAAGGLSWSGGPWNAEGRILWVGSQFLDNDLTNQRHRLPGYATADLSVRYRKGPVTAEAVLTNLLDRKYAGRGITNGFTDYFTPAPPRALRVNLTWSF